MVMIDGYVRDPNGRYVEDAYVTVSVRRGEVDARVSAPETKSGPDGYWVADFECPEGCDCFTGKVKASKTIYKKDGTGGWWEEWYDGRYWSTHGTNKVNAMTLVIKKSF